MTNRSRATGPRSGGVVVPLGRRRVRGLVHPDQLTTSPTLEAEIRHDLSVLFQDMKALRSEGAGRFEAEYLEREIFSKYLDPDNATGAEERKTAAIAKWKAAELRNQTTNERLLLDECVFSLKGKDVSSTAIFATARDTIRCVLGANPDSSVLNGTFTSGASTLFQRRPGALTKKFMDEAHVTLDAMPWFAATYRDSEGWHTIRDESGTKLSDVELVEGSMMFTVPKTSMIDRCAAKEPGLNMYLQKGVGAFIRHRLRSVLQQDLTDQSRNRELARVGSEQGNLATLDLSSASDLISTQLVVELLPPGWFMLLNDIRSKKCLVDDELHELHMFSGMGNAFTFELETLLFWALVNSCAYHTGERGTISVYGDDIVCPAKVAGFVCRVFDWCGFKVNSKKSYWKGHFRESCGGHFYAGMDVTPFYVKEPIRSIPRLIHFLNRFRNWSGKGGFLSPECEALWAKYAALVPRVWRGGRDLASIEQLVTDESPIGKLVRVRENTCPSEAGSYLHWLRVADRSDDRAYVSVRRTTSGVAVDIREATITSQEMSETSEFKTVYVSATEKHQTSSPASYTPGWSVTPV